MRRWTSWWACASGSRASRRSWWGAAIAGSSPPRVVLLGAVDPPRAVGRWIPDQVRLAGGWELLGQDGGPAEPTTWDAVRDMDPEVLVLLPDGLPLPEAIRAWEASPRPEGWADLRAVRDDRVFVVDGGAFVLPGPAGDRRDRDPRRADRPRRVRRHVAAGDLGPRQLTSRDPRGLPTDLRLPVVRDRVDDAWPQRPGGLGPAVPGLPRPGRARTRSCAGACARRSPSGCRRSRRARLRPPPRPATPPRPTTPPRSRSRRQAPAVRPVSRANPYPAFPDDWFLRRGPFERGAIHDAAWAAELDMVTRWLDGLPLAGRIVEPAAGVGFFSPLLAERGELFASDADGAALDRARDRLLAHHLRAHLHVADPWAVPPAGGPDAGTGADAGAGAAGGPERATGPMSWSPRSWSVASAEPASTTPPPRSAPGSAPAGSSPWWTCVRTPPAARPPGVAWTWHEPAAPRGGAPPRRVHGPPGGRDRPLLPDRRRRRPLTALGTRLSGAATVPPWAGALDPRWYPPPRCRPSPTAPSPPWDPASWPRP